MSSRGILVAGYMDEAKDGFDELTMQQKFEASRNQIERLHPGHSHNWNSQSSADGVKWNEGSWIAGLSQEDYDAITSPDGPIYFVGDHTSHLVGW